MKMVRSLLLGTAAGLVAVAGAQAADMPVRAAVQYVKICNLYGDGFYYLPGTNICVKIGGYVRAQWGYMEGASSTNGPFQTGLLIGPSSAASAVSVTGQNGYNTRFDGGDFNIRARAYISMDTREQTDYGVLRTYLNIGLNYDSPAAGAGAIFSGNRAFMQFAGFTVGLAQSFFDFYSIPASQYNGFTPASDTGDGGWKVAAFTANFGNGLTSTFSFEEPRRIGIVNTDAAGNPFTLFGAAVGQNGVTGTAGADSAKERFPDMVYNIRIDQVWGSAQVMFAAHDASAAYYFSTTANPTATSAAFGQGVNCPAAVAVSAFGTPGSVIGSEVCGHPADTLGWAAGAGFRINVPNLNGSYFQFQYTYSKGAARYVDQTQTGYFSFRQGGTLGFGFLTDGIVNNFTGGVDLTRVQGINVAYDHHWTPKLWTSIYGSWMKVSYDQAANASICAVQNQAFATGGALNAPTGFAALGGAAAVLPVCANDFTFFTVGSRWQWNLTPAQYIGFDTTWQRLNTADNGGLVNWVNGATPIASVSAPGNLYQVANQSTWSFQMRFHRDILP